MRHIGRGHPSQILLLVRKFCAECELAALLREFCAPRELAVLARDLLALLVGGPVADRARGHDDSGAFVAPGVLRGVEATAMVHVGLAGRRRHGRSCG